LFLWAHEFLILPSFMVPFWTNDQGNSIEQT
jgi:hypothetical protein